MYNLTMDYNIYKIRDCRDLILEDVKQLYLIENLTQQEISDIMHCSPQTIGRFCRKNGLKKTPEQIRENNKKTTKRFWDTVTPEKRQQIKESHKKVWDNMSEEQMELWKKTVSKNSKWMWENMSKDQKEQVRSKMSKSAIEYLSTQTTEQKNHRIEQFKHTWYSATDEEKTLRNKKNSNTKKRWWDNITEEQLQHRTQHWKNSMESKSQEEKSLIQQKIYETKKANGSLNTSKQELEIQQILESKYIVMTQYKCREFPFACDFYLPQLKLFIDYNEMWTHGKEPFDSNNTQHQEILNFWKSKNTKFYKNAIYTWTDLDVRKTKLANKNGINRLVFYTMEQFKHWWEDFNNGS